jgi:hypothetical protein
MMLRTLCDTASGFPFIIHQITSAVTVHKKDVH